jgi:hypothetical protein
MYVDHALTQPVSIFSILIVMTECHGSAGTPLGTHANGEDSGLEESRKAIRT